MLRIQTAQDMEGPGESRNAFGDGGEPDAEQQPEAYGPAIFHRAKGVDAKLTVSGPLVIGLDGSGASFLKVCSALVAG
jgi:hypothetical protein